MQETWGGSLTKTRTASARWEEAWTWTLSGRAAANFLTEIAPYLLVKQEQAGVAMELEALKASQPRRANGATEWSAKHEAECSALKTRLNELNTKGPRALTAEVS